MTPIPPTLFKRFLGFARRLFTRNPPITRTFKVTITGPVDRRMQFAYTAGALDDAELLFGTSSDEADVYLVTLGADEDIFWFVADAYGLDLKAEVSEVAA